MTLSLKLNRAVASPEIVTVVPLIVHVSAAYPHLLLFPSAWELSPPAAVPFPSCTLPASVKAAVKRDGRLGTVTIPVKTATGALTPEAIPSVSIVKDGSYAAEEFGSDPAPESDLAALIEGKLTRGRLAGFVLEGLVPYGSITSEVRQQMLYEAIFAGLPSVRVGRGSPEGFADPHPYFIAGSNLTATKARLLLMACLMKLGSLPIAVDPARPSETEMAATRAAIARYQAVFDTH